MPTATSQLAAPTPTPVPAPVPAARLDDLAAQLRAGLGDLIQHLAGTPPRPIRLTRDLGLDKSLASRLVQANRAESDAEFLHRVPSPTGLRMLLDAARAQAVPGHLLAVADLIDQFDQLIGRLPGGRQALDAQLGEASDFVRVRREHMARQASFKALSFLFGHYTETLVTALFLLPSADGRHVDVIEVHRRLGLHRVTPGTPLPLLSLHTPPPEVAGQQGAVMTSLKGDAHTRHAGDFVMAEASSAGLPALQVEREGHSATFVLAGDDDEPLPARLTTALRVVRAETLTVSASYRVLRSYLLHSPCQRLVRDLYLAEGLWPGAVPEPGFYLPGPSGAQLSAPEPGRRHYRQLNLSAHFEALPGGEAGFALAGVPDQTAALQSVLARAGLAAQGWMGWRCEMSYPVPLIEMQVALRWPVTA
jgi:hypothetical protein